MASWVVEWVYGSNGVIVGKCESVYAIDEFIMVYNMSDLQLLPVQLSTTSAQFRRRLFGGDVALRLSHHLVPIPISITLTKHTKEGDIPD